MGCCCNNDPAGDGDCAHVADLIRSCQKWYGTQSARDTVDAATLAGVLEDIANQINRHSIAFSQLLREDCTLRDGLILCRHLSEEIGVSCLIGRGGEPPTPPTPPGPQPGGPILDFFQGPTAAFAGWGLRRLRTAYTGPLIRVRRALDNAETDIGYDDDGLVDTLAITSFAQNSDVFVTTIYEQVGQVSHDLSQSVPGQQPKIYDSISGFQISDAGRICIFFDGIDDFMIGPNTDLAYTSEILASMAMQWHTVSNGQLYYLGARGLVGEYKRPTDDYQYIDGLVGGEDFPGVEVTGRTNEPWVLTVASDEGGSPVRTYSRLNGSLKGTGDGGFTQNASNRLHLACNDSLGNIGNLEFHELIYFDSVDWAQFLTDLGDTLVGALENNMMQTWGVTPDP